MSAQVRQIRRAHASDWPAWEQLRRALWPQCDTALAVLQQMQEDSGKACFIALDDTGEPAGLIEASVRKEYVNGTSTSPVAFLEAWYVAPQWRGQGIGRRLLDEVSRWASVMGCSELASDTPLDNTGAQAAHAHCGFTETERVVYYTKAIGTHHD